MQTHHVGFVQILKVVAGIGQHFLVEVVALPLFGPPPWLGGPFCDFLGQLGPGPPSVQTWFLL